MTRKEAIAEGYKHYCLHCHNAYKELPDGWYEDGHGGRLINICKKCGCDLFEEF